MTGDQLTYLPLAILALIGMMIIIPILLNRRW